MLYLILINVCLFFGCYIAGCIPISFKIPMSKIRLLTVFGAGLLLGAALVVVIPEGVAAIYQSHSHPHDQKNHQHNPISRKLHALDSGALNANENPPLSVNNNPDQNKNEDVEKHNSLSRSDNDKNHEHTHNDTNIHQKIGLALLLGYLFMLLIDQLSYTVLELTCCQGILFGLKRLCCRSTRYIPLIDKSSSSASNSTSSGSGNPSVTITVGKNAATLNTINATVNPASNLLNENSNQSTTTSSSIQSANHKGFIVTCGLVIHSLADGLAIGSAFALNQLQLEIILFLAIILHKIPAAFGLSCFLLHEGFPRDRIRLHMIAFSLSSPLAAFFTYFYLSVSSTALVDDDVVVASTRTGFALLLSGGTFLYVAATHILPELISSSGCGSPASLNHHNNNNNSINIGKQTRHTESEDLSGRLSDYALFTVDSSHESVIMYNHPKANEYLNAISPVHRLSVIEIIVLSAGTIVPILLSAGHSH
ncbi:unnamed protein product [Trichobilharzia szidati]|nr:unnamed protein product [Trichobilharzia szidati]